MPASASIQKKAVGDDESVGRALNVVRGIVRAMRVNTRAIEQELGISLAQLFVLEHLAERPANSLNELAARTATHQSSVSVVVRRLVDRDLVAREASEQDRRRILLTLTPTGRALLARAPETIQARLIAGLQELSARDRETLAGLLDRWMQGAGIDVVRPPLLGEDG